MRLTKRLRMQLWAFAIIASIGGAIMFFDLMQIPTTFFGVGRYTVLMKLPEAGGLYPTGNVTYRGVQAGRVEDVKLTDNGAEAVLSMNSSVKVPSDLTAEVHSVSAIGEQYVALVPRSGNGPLLKDGDVIPANRTYVPPDINSLLGALNKGVEAIPRDNLKTAVDQGYIAFGGLGPELSRLVGGLANLSIDARKDLDSLTALIDNAKPVFDSQAQTSDSIQGWAAHLAAITKQLQAHDAAVGGLLQKGPPAADEVRALLDRLSPTLPIVLANLVSVGQVAVTYRDDIEALLVELPQGAADIQAVGVANRNVKSDYKAAFLSFNLNINTPPPCTTGFLPIQQQRAASFQDYPEIPKGDVYCRVPQDSPLNVRGARNTPCETKPGKRAPTAAMCESDEQYVPLNDGFNWKGDPNATYTGQSVPQTRTGQAPPPGRAPDPPPPPPTGPLAPPMAAVTYDPATGMYVGPDGRAYTQSNLAHGAGKERTWQQMLTPKAGN